MNLYVNIDELNIIYDSLGDRFDRYCKDRDKLSNLYKSGQDHLLDSMDRIDYDIEEVYSLMKKVHKLILKYNGCI